MKGQRKESALTETASEGYSAKRAGFRRRFAMPGAIAAVLAVAVVVFAVQGGFGQFGTDGPDPASPALPKAQSLAEESDAQSENAGWADTLFGQDANTAKRALPYADDSLEKFSSVLHVVGGEGEELSLADVPESEYQGFMFKVASADTVGIGVNEVVSNALAAGKIRQVHGDVYAADSLDTLAELFSADQLEYVEPDYRMHLIGEVGIDDDARSSADEAAKAQGGAVPASSASSAASVPSDSAVGASAAESAQAASGVATAAAAAYPLGGTDKNPAPDWPPTDPDYVSGDLWNLDMLNVPGAWAAGLDGDPYTYNGKALREDNVRVAVIDTGLYGTGPSEDEHEDLDYSKMFSGTNYVTDDEGTPDAHGHGTFVAGLIAAKANNGIGVVGAMPGVEVLSEKVFDTGSAKTSDIIEAIYAATDEHSCDVINMSLGGEYNDRTLEVACDYAVGKGVLVVASAGNDGVSTPNYPAAYDSVVGVASVNSSKARSTWSQYGKSVFVTAPGENVRSTFTGAPDSYKTASGTSFSGPEVAALAAMCKSVYPDIDQDTFKKFLIDTSEDLGGKGYDDFYGWGLVDFSKVAEAVLASQVLPWYNVAFEVTDEDGRAITASDTAITVTADEDIEWDADPDSGIENAGKWTKGTKVEPESNGTYKLHRGNYAFAVVSDGKYTAQGVFKTYAENQLVSVKLSTAYGVILNVVDSAGAPVTGAAQAITSQQGRAETPKSHDDGASSAVYDLASGIYSYEASADGYESASGTFTVQRADKSINAVLYKSNELATIGFSVADGEGGAINGASIAVEDASGVTISAQGDGAYRLAKGATYTATASKAGFESSSTQFTVGTEATQTVSLSMRRASNKITFNVVDDAGKAIGTATAKVADGAGAPVDPMPANSLQFGLVEGDYTYEVSAPGYESKTGSFGVALDSYTITVVLESVPSKVSFTITDEGTGAAVADATVKVNLADRLRAIEQNALNSYLLAPGDYAYTVHKEGYRIAQGNFTVAGEDLTVNVKLQAQAAGAGFAGGSGTEDDPYLIANEDQLRYLAQLTEIVRATSMSASTNKKETIEGHYKLVDDISLAQGQWLPIGNCENTNNYVAFGGEFDGAGHTVTGVSISNCTYDYQGFFGYVRGAYIHDLVVDGDIEVDGKNASSGGQYVGGIVGGAYSANDPLYTSGNVAPTTIERCGNLADVTGRYAVGGIAGSLLCPSPSTGNPEGTTTDWSIFVKDCFNKGDIRGMLHGSYLRETGVGSTAAGKRVGGIVGSGQYIGIENCYNAGEVQAGSVVGGIAGYAAYSGIATSYSSGRAYQHSNASGDGGMTGLLAGSTVQTSATDSFGMKRDDNYQNALWGSFTRSESNNVSMLPHADMYRTAEFVKQMNTNTSSDPAVESQAFAAGNDYPMLSWETGAGAKLAATPVVKLHPKSMDEADAYVQGATAEALSAEIEEIAADDGSVTWQWYVSDSDSFKAAKPIAGATGTGFKASHVPSTAEVGLAYYFCVFTSRLGIDFDVNEASAATHGAAVYVRTGERAQVPVITQLNPNGTSDTNLNMNAKQGTDLELSVTATVSDGGALTYQWYYSESGSGSGTALAGATNAVYRVDTSKLGTGYYYVEITNTTGPGNTAKALSDWVKVTVDPYTIDSYQELAAFRTAVNSGNTFAGQIVYLQSDIAMPDGVDWTPIGTDGHPFCGTFMGGTGYAGSEPETVVVHKITGVNVNGDAHGNANLGLFGVVVGGTICDVQVGGTVTGAKNACAGLLVGQITLNGTVAASVENCGTLAGSNVEGAYAIGGLVGYSGAVLSNCANHADVHARPYAGNLGSGAVTTDGLYAVGGLVGYQNNGNVLGCYNTGDVAVDAPSEADGTVCATRAGGVAGYVGYYSGMASCYNAGTLQLGTVASSQYQRGVLYAGSVAGYLTYGNGVNLYYAEGTYERGTDSSDGEDAAEVRSVQFMKTAYFNNLLNTATGNYSYNQFRMSANGVPHLVWEDDNVSGDGICSAEPYITKMTSADFPDIATTGKASFFQGIAPEPIIVWADTPDGGAMRYEWSKRAAGQGDDAWVKVAEGAMTPDENGKNGQAPLNVDVSEQGEFEYRCEVFNKRADATVEPLEESMYIQPISITVKDASGVIALRDPAAANSKDNPWVIDSPAKMKFFADIVNGDESYRPIGDPTFARQYVELAADIDLSEYDGWKPIGSNTATYEPTAGVFAGFFDGAGHTVSGLSIENTGRNDFNGLFGQARMARISNLEVVGSVRMDSASAFGTGGVAGYAYGCYIENVVNRVNVVGAVKTGGIVGYAVSCKIKDCENVGSVTMNDELRFSSYGGYDVGGIAGYMTIGSSADGAGVYNCFNNGTVTGGLYDGDYRIGALVGGSDGTLGATTMKYNYYRAASIVVDGGAGTGFGGGSFDPVPDKAGMCVSIDSADSPETAWALDTCDGTAAHSKRWSNYFREGVDEADPCVHLVRPPASSPLYKIDTASSSAVVKASAAYAQAGEKVKVSWESKAGFTVTSVGWRIVGTDDVNELGSAAEQVDGVEFNMPEGDVEFVVEADKVEGFEYKLSAEVLYNDESAPSEAGSVSFEVERASAEPEASGGEVGTVAKEGDSVTALIAVASGYQVREVDFTDVYGVPVQASRVDGLKYTFTMPASDVVCTVELEDTGSLAAAQAESESVNGAATHVATSDPERFAKADLLYQTVVFSGSMFTPDDPWMTYELEQWKNPGLYQQTYSIADEGVHAYTGIDVAKMLRSRSNAEIPADTPISFEAADGTVLSTTYGQLTSLAYSGYDAAGQPFVRGLPVLLYFGVDGVPNEGGAMGIVFGQESPADDNASKRIVGVRRICVGDDVSSMQHVYAPYNDFDRICGGKANDQNGYTNLTVRVYQGGTGSQDKGTLVSEKVIGLDQIESMASADRANIGRGYLAAYLYEDRTSATTGKYTDYYEGYDLYKVLQAAGVPAVPGAKVQFYQTGMNGLANSRETVDVSLDYLAGNGAAGVGDYSGNTMSYNDAEDSGSGPTSGTMTNVKPLLLYGKNGLPLVWSSGTYGVGAYNYNYRGPMAAFLPQNTAEGGDHVGDKSVISCYLGLVEVYVPGDTPAQSEEAKALGSAVQAAKALADDVAVSADGKDVEAGKPWTTQAAKDALSQAIADAQAVAEKPYATSKEIADALDALNAAVDTFNASKQSGTKPTGGGSDSTSGGTGVGGSSKTPSGSSSGAQLTAGSIATTTSPASVDPAKQLGADGSAVGKGASAVAADKAITASTSEEGPAGSKYAVLQLKSAKQTAKSITISWKKAKGAKKFVVYGNACGKGKKMVKVKTLAKNSLKVTKLAGKKLKKGTYYKLMVVALDQNNNVVSTSKVIHVATAGGKVGNYKSVTTKAKKNRVTLKKGKSFKLGAKQVQASKKLKVKKHRVLMYESSNASIATVSKKGVIKAKKKGSCYVYAYTQSGTCRAVKVTVK